MLKWLYNKMVFMVVLFCMSCSSSVPTLEELRRNPLPLPDFTFNLATQITSERYNCVANISERAIWQEGNTAEYLRREIQQSTTFTLDEQPVVEIDFPGDLLTPFSVYNDIGELLGSHGHTLSVCFQTPSMAVGWHVAELEIRDVNSQSYSHMWAIEIIGAGE
ncbi:MAG: hypothetical protein SF123_16100 [Chloroflexota bacterium]|nr:hypothetical protein [Chloroflexota bacterium]